MPVIFEEWRNQNELIGYPFTDGADLARGTSLELPTNLVVDARLYPIGAEGVLYLSSIQTVNSTVILSISDDLGWIASGDFTPEEEIVTLQDKYGRPAGVLVCDPVVMSSLSSWAAGAREYTPTNTAFATAAIIPTPQIGVRGFILESGEFFTGDFWLVGENGVYFTNEGGNIRVDIIGDTLSQRRICEQLNAYSQPWFVKTLNSLGPSKYGDFKLVSGTGLASDTALRFEPAQGGMTIAVAGSN
jgi:hypothetical protein